MLFTEEAVIQNLGTGNRNFFHVMGHTMELKNSIFNSLKKFGEELIGSEKLKNLSPSSIQVSSALLRKREAEETTHIDSMELSVHQRKKSRISGNGLNYTSYNELGHQRTKTEP